MDIKAYIESGAIESFVLGLSTEEEAAETRMLCSQHPEIQQAVNDFAAAIEQEACRHSVAPPPEVREKLLSRLAPEFAIESPVPVIPLQPAQGKSGGKSWKYLAAASIVLFLVSAGFNIYFYQNFQNTNNRYQALLSRQTSLQASNDVFRTKLDDFSQSLKLIANPDMHVVPLKDVTGKNNNLATVYWDTQTRDVYLLQNNLPSTPADKQYQLWAIVNGKPVDAGVISDCAGLCKLKNIPQAQAFAITLEKAGGSPTPTLTAMYVMGKV